MHPTLSWLIVFTSSLVLSSTVPVYAFDAFGWVTGDSKEVIYRTSDDHMHELSYNLREGFWRCADLSALSDAPTPASGAPQGTPWPIGGTKQVIFKTSRANATISLTELSFEGDGQWHYKDLFQTVGRRRRPFGNFSASYQNTGDGTKQVAFISGSVPSGQQDHVVELKYGLDNQWVTTDLTALTGAEPATSNYVYAYAWEGGERRQVLHHYHNTLAEFTRDVNGQWTWDLIEFNQTAGMQPIGYGTGPGNRPDLTRKVVVWIDNARGIQELSAGLDGVWLTQDLTRLAQAPRPIRGSPLIGYYEGAVGDTRQVFYMTENGHIHELWTGWDGIWHHIDVTAEANAPSALADVGLGGFPWGLQGEKVVVYMAFTGEIHELSKALSVAQPRWRDVNLSRVAQRNSSTLCRPY